MAGFGFGCRVGRATRKMQGGGGPALPDLVLTPSAVTTNTTAPAGMLLAVLTNVPAGVTPTVTPNDGRVVIAGSEAVGWEVQRGATAGSAGLTNFTVSAAGANSATLAVTFITQWALGLDATPAYVPWWVRPSSVAAGKLNGSIPADAIAFETGNAGGPFPDVNAWIDACNAAGKDGAIETSVSFSGKVQKRLNVSLYGAGAAKPTIEWLSRVSSSSTGGNGRQCWLYADREDIKIRGIAFKNFCSVLGTTYPTQPTTDDTGALQNDGYASSNQYEWQVLGCRNDGTPENSFGFHHRRLGRIVGSGAFTITDITVRRQIDGTPQAGSSGAANNNVYYSDAAFDAVCETITLVAGASCTTHAQARDAINAGSATHNYAAELNRAGQVIVTPVDWTTKAFSKITVTGTGSIYADCQTPGVEVSYCDFIDVNCAVISYIDVSCLGVHKFHKNDLPGTWGGASLFCHQWSDIYAANNYWRDVRPSRPVATGRTASTPTNGGGLIAFGSLVYVGSNYPHLMRYTIPRGNDVRFENNYKYQVNDTKNTDNVNTGVMCDLRNGSQNSANGRYIYVRYNLEIDGSSPNGGDDAATYYGKCRGGTWACNFSQGFGAAYFSPSFNGTECGYILLKEPGPFAANYGGYEPEPIVLKGCYADMGPQGLPFVKIDNCYGGTVVRDMEFVGYEAVSNGVESTLENAHGCVRLTGYHKSFDVQGIKFTECYPGVKATLTMTKPWLLVNLHDIRNALGVAFVSSQFTIANLILANTGVGAPVINATTALCRINFGGNGPASTAAFYAALPTGGNRILDAAGADVGNKWLIYNQSNTTTYLGNEAIPVAPFVPQSTYLASYGAAL